MTEAPIPTLSAVLKALSEEGITPTSDVALFFEGEEAVGPTHLAQCPEIHLGLVDPADVWLSLDGSLHHSGRPQVEFGVRGVTGTEITVYGPVRPLQSGHYECVGSASSRTAKRERAHARAYQTSIRSLHRARPATRLEGA